MKRSWVSVLGWVVVGSAVAIAACGSGSAPPGAAEALFEELHARSEAGGGALRPYNSVAELLENTRYKQGQAKAKPLTEAVILGEVTEVLRGRGFRVEGNDAPDGIETDYDDERALWRTVHARVNVESLVSGQTDGVDVLVGFAFDAETPFAVVRDGLLSLDRVLLFLSRSPVFAYDSALYGTVRDGSLLGVVDAEGRITLPALEDEERSELLRATPTVSDLRKAAAGPTKTIELDESGARKST